MRFYLVVDKNLFVKVAEEFGASILVSFYGASKKLLDSVLSFKGYSFIDSYAFTLTRKYVGSVLYSDVADWSWVDGKMFRDYFENYVEWLLHNRNLFGDKVFYATLDVIGNGELTYKIFREMVERGLNPLPVWHYMTDFKYLRRYIDEGYDYIAIGGIVQASTVASMFYDQLFKYVPGDIKLHLFGVVALPILMKYRFYSADASSWIRMAGIGKVYMPTFVEGRVDCINFKVFKVTAREMHSKVVTFEDYLSCVSNVEYVYEWFRQAGINVEGNNLRELLEKNYVRARLNMFYFKKLEEQITEYWNNRSFEVRKYFTFYGGSNDLDCR